MRLFRSGLSDRTAEIPPFFRINEITARDGDVRAGKRFYPGMESVLGEGRGLDYSLDSYRESVFINGEDLSLSRILSSPYKLSGFFTSVTLYMRMLHACVRDYIPATLVMDSIMGILTWRRCYFDSVMSAIPNATS